MQTISVPETSAAAGNLLRASGSSFSLGSASRRHALAAGRAWGKQQMFKEMGTAARFSMRAQGF
jgi:hypothetical protein